MFRLRKGFLIMVLTGALMMAGIASASAKTVSTSNCPLRSYYFYQTPYSAGQDCPNYYQIIFRNGQASWGSSSLPKACPSGENSRNQEPSSASPQAPSNGQHGENPQTQEPSPAPTPEPTPTGQADQYERQVLDLINQYRAEAGLNSLVWDSTLADLARTKSEDMSEHNYFSHQSPTLGSAFDMMQQAGVKYRYAGENIAAGQQTPEAVVTSWMNSPGHRANILNSNFTRTGIGFADGGSYGTYWTQMFIGN